MALDEYLFGQLARYIRNRKRVAAAAQENAVHLETMRQRLTILAAAVSGAAIEIFPAEVEGGYKNNAFFFARSLFHLSKFSPKRAILPI